MRLFIVFANVVFLFFATDIETISFLICKNSVNSVMWRKKRRNLEKFYVDFAKVTWFRLTNKLLGKRHTVVGEMHFFSHIAVFARY